MSACCIPAVLKVRRDSSENIKGAYEWLNDSYRSIFAAWLPASGSVLRNAPCFEKYLNRDPRRTKPENLRTEIWLPVE